jgi:hypothetical protein
VYWDELTVEPARAAANWTGRVNKWGTCKSPNRFYLISFLVGLNKVMRSDVDVVCFGFVLGCFVWF